LWKKAIWRVSGKRSQVTPLNFLGRPDVTGEARERKRKRGPGEREKKQKNDYDDSKKPRIFPDGQSKPCQKKIYDIVGTTHKGDWTGG